MDKFDEIIKNSSVKIQPSKDFVDKTMQKIALNKSPRHFSWKLWLPTLSGAMAVLALALIILPLNSRPTNNSSQNTNLTTPANHSQSSNNKTTTNVKGNSNPSTSTNSYTVAAGTDNASLNSALNNINVSMNQGNSDLNTATTALNDSSQQITIPTD